jgi:hypothetical protein
MQWVNQANEPVTVEYVIERMLTLHPHPKAHWNSNWCKGRIDKYEENLRCTEVADVIEISTIESYHATLYRRGAYSYTVIDPQGVYSNQVVEVNFEIDPVKQSHHVVLSNIAALKAIAIERMYGASLQEVDSSHIRDMFESVYIEGLKTGGATGVYAP